VGGVDRPRQRLDQLRRLTRDQRLALELAGEAPPGAVLQRQERHPLVDADLVDLHDVGVRQPAHRLGLELEPPQVLLAGVAARQDHLQRH
jgi:hypothetical protein